MLEAWPRAIRKLSMAWSKSSTPSPYFDSTVAITPPTCSHRFLRWVSLLGDVGEEVEFVEWRRSCVTGSVGVDGWQRVACDGVSMTANDAAGSLLARSRSTNLSAVLSQSKVCWIILLLEVSVAAMV